MFDLYPTTSFRGQSISNITRRFILNSVADRNGITIYQDYIIKNWESPETIAFKLYGSCDYDWVILLANNIIDPFSQWLMKQDELSEYVREKYTKPNDIHHWEKDGIVYYSNVLGSKSVTNFEYEFDRNEKKRKINVVRPELIGQINETLLSVA